VTITLEDEIDISRGDMIVRRRNLPQAATELECTLCWMSETPMNPAGAYLLQHTTRQVRAFITEVTYRIDVDTLHREPVTALALNEIGRVKITTTQPVFFDPYQINRTTGSFVLIDPFSNNTMAAGMIRRRARDLDEIVSQAPARQRSSDVVWEEARITRAMREQLNGHSATVLWFTGLSGSGKSTIARLLERRLFGLGVRTFMLDGDNLRHGLNGDLSFSATDRTENIRRAAEVAKLAFDHGSLVLCSFISPFRADRDVARSLLPGGAFLEIYVACDVEVCKRRDPKGLYARALAGEVADFTGVSSPYEEPLQPDLLLDSSVLSPEQSVARILEELRNRGIIS
jgi:bifunctional enzyme CysN/CysC